MEKEGEIKIKQINHSTNPFNGKIIAIILTIMILVIGTLFYFIVSGKSNITVNNTSKMDSNDNSVKETNSKFQISELQNDNVYMKTTSEGIQKLFYYHPVNEPINIPLSEGNIGEYQIHSIGGQKYYPLIVGYEEAKTMRQEGLFYNIGDPIKGFFGKNVVIIGVMQRTGGAMDLAHIIPLSSGELN